MKNHFKSGFFYLCLGFIILFCLLGEWQMHRYHVKKQLIESYKPLEVQGYYLNPETIFVSRPDGFEMFTPLKISAQNKLLLVDRGLVKKAEPVILSGKQTIKGYIKLPEYQFILGNNILEPHKRPLVLQKMDLKDVSQVLHHDFYPYVLRLDSNLTITMPPSRHIMYALQWFSFALITMIGYVCFCRGRKHEK